MRAFMHFIRLTCQKGAQYNSSLSLSHHFVSRQLYFFSFQLSWMKCVKLTCGGGQCHKAQVTLFFASQKGGRIRITFHGSKDADPSLPFSWQFFLLFFFCFFIPKHLFTIEALHGWNFYDTFWVLIFTPNLTTIDSIFSFFIPIPPPIALLLRLRLTSSSSLQMICT